MITKENLTKGSTIYQAKDVVVQVETVGNHDPNTIRTVEKNVAEMEEISVVNVIFGHLMFKFHFRIINSFACFFRMRNMKQEPPRHLTQENLQT